MLVVLYIFHKRESWWHWELVMCWGMCIRGQNWGPVPKGCSLCASGFVRSLEALWGILVWCSTAPPVVMRDGTGIQEPGEESEAQRCHLCACPEEARKRQEGAKGKEAEIFWKREIREGSQSVITSEYSIFAPRWLLLSKEFLFEVTCLECVALPWAGVGNVDRWHGAAEHCAELLASATVRSWLSDCGQDHFWRTF